MTHTYNITGMTCSSCIAKVRNELLKLGDISEANVQLQSPQATLSMQHHISLDQLQKAISKAGGYTIAENQNETRHSLNEGKPASWLATYKPVLLIGVYLLAATLLPYVKKDFTMESWMPNFMAGFFLTFSFFKLLDLKGFAQSYSTYDIIAKRWSSWGFVYAFIELGLGIAYLLHIKPLLVNGVSFVIMSVSIIGVLQSVFNKRKIKCACLGVVFNLPMSTVTIIEDALMILMSGMLITQLI